MIKSDEIFDFITTNKISIESIDNFCNEKNIERKKLIGRIFRFLNNYISKPNLLDNNDIAIIKKAINMLKIICEKETLSDESIADKIKKIRKLKQSLISLASLQDNYTLIEISKKLDEIFEKNNGEIKDILSLLLILIKKQENINIIRKIINLNTSVTIINDNELFKYAFDKSIEALKDNSNDIYYYITILNIAYHPTINKKYYIEKLDKELDITNNFTLEIYQIINGIPSELHNKETLEKYFIKENLQPFSINIKKDILTPDRILTIDGKKTLLRDDGLSIKKDGNNYILGIHIADVGGILVPNSIADKQALNNYECIYFKNRTRTRILNTEMENELSLNTGKEKPLLSQYIIMNENAEIIDYELKETTSKISINLNYNDSQLMIDRKLSNGFEQDIQMLYNLAIANEMKNPKRKEYWEKKNGTDINAGDIINREFMVLYNILMSKLAVNNKFNYTFRTQDEDYISAIIEKENIKLNSDTQKLIKNIYMESKYTFEPKKHAGLELDYYSTTVDPLRRYQDLFNQYLIHLFYFKDINFEYTEELHKDLIEYFNIRRTELNIMKQEYDRKLKLQRK